MAVKPARVTVLDTPTRLDVTTEADAVQGSNEYSQRFGQHFMFRNRHATLSIFVGDSGVTTSTGFEVLPNETFFADIQTGDAVYGVTTASGSALAHVFQSGV